MHAKGTNLEKHVQKSDEFIKNMDDYKNANIKLLILNKILNYLSI